MLEKIKEKLIPKKTFYFKSQNYNSLEMFREMLLFLNSFAKILGCNTFTPGYSPINPVFIIIMTFMFSLIAEHFYCIYIYRDDSYKMIFCILSVPTIIQAAVKIYSFIINRDKLYIIFSHVDTFHQTFYEATTRKVMEECIMNSCHLCLVLSILMITGGVLVLSYPVLFYVIFGERVLHFGFHLIFIDFTKPLGYALNIFNNFFAVSTFIIGTILTCIDISMCVLNAFGQVNVLKIYLKELDELAKAKDEKKEVEIKEKIAQIIDLHNFFIE